MTDDFATDSRDDTDETCEPREAPESRRRKVGFVRVLRGRLGAPCRCCQEAAAPPARETEPRA